MYLGERFAKTSAAQANSAALLLSNLLKSDESDKAPAPPPEEEKAPAKKTTRLRPPPGTPLGTPKKPDQPAATGMSPELTKAIVYALGATRSDTGRKALKQVLAGTFGVEDDRVATAAALESLAFYASPQNEEILLNVLAAPESIRKAKEAPSPEQAPAEAGQDQSETPPKKATPDRPSGYATPATTQPAPNAAPARAPRGPVIATVRPAMPKVPLGGVGSGEMTPQEMQALALKWIGESASLKTRVKIAEIVEQGSLPEDLHSECMQLLQEPRPENVPAQVILYQSMQTGGEVRTDLFAELTKFSSEALRTILGIPAGVSVPPMPSAQGGLVTPGVKPGAMTMGTPRPAVGAVAPGATAKVPKIGRPGLMSPATKLQQIDPNIDQNTAYQLAGSLWSAELVASVQGQLVNVASLSADLPSALMASTMPLDSVRTELYNVFKKSSEEGPNALGSSGLFQDIVFEPGLLAVVKLMPRKDRPLPATTPGNTARPNSRTGYGTTRPTLPNSVADDTAKKEQAAQEWMTLSEGLLRALCARLKATAASVDVNDLPIKVHPDARVTVSYRFEWPTEAAKKMSGVTLDPIKVYYVCLEQKARPNGVLGFYKHWMPNATVHELEKDIWAESFRPVPNSDQRQSIDVLIERPESAVEPPAVQQPLGQQPGTRQPLLKPPVKQQDEDLVIEILVIELKDPLPASASEETTQ